MLHRIRYMGRETKYSALSVLSLLAVIALHLVHWLSAPMLMGAAAEMHAHHHEMGGSGSNPMQWLMLALFIINLISMYFAVRQLALAWKKRRDRTHHTYMCSAVSIGVLSLGIYTAFIL
ncbi:hypothetical protein [Cohnella sp.]|uniref:hypothetical protein n=1 Tax=Cohnella sp. TaxID=1883426 RepID=UPI00356AD92F